MRIFTSMEERSLLAFTLDFFDVSATFHNRLADVVRGLRNFSCVAGAGLSRTTRHAVAGLCPRVRATGACAPRHYRHCNRVRPDGRNPAAAQCRAAVLAGQFCFCRRTVQSFAGRRSGRADLHRRRSVAGRQRSTSCRGESSGAVEQGARRSADVADVGRAIPASLRRSSRGACHFYALPTPACRAARVNT